MSSVNGGEILANGFQGLCIALNMGRGISRLPCFSPFIHPESSLGFQVKHLGAPSARQGQHKDNSPVPSADWSIGDRLKQFLGIDGGQASGWCRRCFGALQLVAGIGAHKAHMD